MPNIMMKNEHVNLVMLNQKLRTELSEAVTGVSFDGTQVIVHLNETATPVQIASATALVEAHDPMLLTPEQEAEKARTELLTQMRQERQPLDPDKLGATANDIKALGRRIALLELEIDALRGR